jgi:hypothetical protein
MSVRRSALGLVRKPGRFAAIIALGVVALTLAAAASAGQLFHETFHDEDTVTIEDFCGEQGLTVEDVFAFDGRVSAVPHGREGLVYFLERITGGNTFTNIANGKSVHDHITVLQKDQLVTNNGDGTLTITVLATGNAVLYDESGRVLARDPGQIRFQILIDDGGTPTDPDDDEFIADLGVVFGSTGRSDDFCEAALTALT